MTRASTGMLEQGTQTPSPSPDLIPARNRPRDGSLKAEIVSMPHHFQRALIRRQQGFRSHLLNENVHDGDTKDETQDALAK